MGKKKKKRTTPRNYTISQFISYVCSTCGACSRDKEPIFCYQMYRLNPKRFINNCLSKISTDTYIKNGLWEDNKVAHFRTLFCDNNVCGSIYAAEGKFCPDIWACIEDFEDQCDLKEESYYDDTTHCFVDSDYYNKTAACDEYLGVYVLKNKHYTKNKTKKYVNKHTANPTFFTNNNEIWRNKIKEILYGHNNIEQDKTG